MTQTSSKMNQEINKIYYQRKGFRILPNLNGDSINGLKKYIEDLQKLYHYNNNQHSFFWKYQNNSIIIDESTELVTNNIYEQLLQIVKWLFENNYQLSGSFFYINYQNIEYIQINKKNIQNLILLNELNLDRIHEKLKILYNGNISDEIIREVVMNKAKHKIKKFFNKNKKKFNKDPKKNLPDTNHLDKIKHSENVDYLIKNFDENQNNKITNEEIGNNLNVNQLYHNETEIMYEIIQDRMRLVENKIEKINNVKQVNTITKKLYVVLIFFIIATFYFCLTYIYEIPIPRFDFNNF